MRARGLVSEIVPQSIRVRGSSVTAVRGRIESKLNVETTAQPVGHLWEIYFSAPSDVDLDFLRPDVLPQKENEAMQLIKSRQQQ